MNKFLDDQGLSHLIEKLQSSGLDGSSSPFFLEVDDQGDLNAYYDDAIGEPTVLKYEESDGNLYAIFETEAA